MALSVISVAQMRQWEQAAWDSGQTEKEVIRKVGACLASRVRELIAPGKRVLVLAGKGNNGEDARHAVPHLQDLKVDLLNVQDPSQDLASLQSRIAEKPSLVIDGLFGIGLNRPLDAAWVRFIEELNGANLPVLAVDVPSGLDAETGTHYGAAVRACETLTVGGPKTGLLSRAAWPFVGRLEVTPDVGLGPCPVSSSGLLWATTDDFHTYPPRRLVSGHKGTYGHLGIVAGSPGYHGAAVLAARGAQRAQPGLITLHTWDAVYAPIASQLQAVMVSADLAGGKLHADYTGVLIGPGLAAPDYRARVQPLTRSIWRDTQGPVVVDASALDYVPIEPPPRNSIRVLTPHPGEAARLLLTTADQVQSGRPAAVRNLSKRYANSWIVLKGHQTLIGRATGEIYVNSSGNPYLGQGGSGDLLAGYIAGLLAQPELAKDALQTIRYAVFKHGEAADRLSRARNAWTVEDLATELGR